VFAGAHLENINFSNSCLRKADFSNAHLDHVHFNSADLSGATGLLNSADWLHANFEACPDGLIVYKRIGTATMYLPPPRWRIESGSVLEEACNTNRSIACGCGVNFGTKEWCDANYITASLWKCLLKWIDLADVVVPYMTDGKARCSRLTLLEAVNERVEA
jgi:uncharacterized protein YjbI with pentapeptide repeats